MGLGDFSESDEVGSFGSSDPSDDFSDTDSGHGEGSEDSCPYDEREFTDFEPSSDEESSQPWFNKLGKGKEVSAAVTLTPGTRVPSEDEIRCGGTPWGWKDFLQRCFVNVNCSSASGGSAASGPAENTIAHASKTSKSRKKKKSTTSKANTGPTKPGLSLRDLDGASVLSVTLAPGCCALDNFRGFSSLNKIFPNAKHFKYKIEATTQGSPGIRPGPRGYAGRLRWSKFFAGLAGVERLELQFPKQFDTDHLGLGFDKQCYLLHTCVPMLDAKNLELMQESFGPAPLWMQPPIRALWGSLKSLHIAADRLLQQSDKTLGLGVIGLLHSLEELSLVGSCSVERKRLQVLDMRQMRKLDKVFWAVHTSWGPQRLYDAASAGDKRKAADEGYLSSKGLCIALPEIEDQETACGRDRLWCVLGDHDGRPCLSRSLRKNLAAQNVKIIDMVPKEVVDGGASDGHKQISGEQKSLSKANTSRIPVLSIADAKKTFGFPDSFTQAASDFDMIPVESMEVLRQKRREAAKKHVAEAKRAKRELALELEPKKKRADILFRLKYNKLWVEFLLKTNTPLVNLDEVEESQNAGSTPSSSEVTAARREEVRDALQNWVDDGYQFAPGVPPDGTQARHEVFRDGDEVLFLEAVTGSRESPSSSGFGGFTVMEKKLTDTDDLRLWRCRVVRSGPRTVTAPEEALEKSDSDCDSVESDADEQAPSLDSTSPLQPGEYLVEIQNAVPLRDTGITERQDVFVSVHPMKTENLKGGGTMSSLDTKKCLPLEDLPAREQEKIEERKTLKILSLEEEHEGFFVDGQVLRCAAWQLFREVPPGWQKAWKNFGENMKKHVCYKRFAYEVYLPGLNTAWTQGNRAVSENMQRILKSEAKAGTGGSIPQEASARSVSGADGASTIDLYRDLLFPEKVERLKPTERFSPKILRGAAPCRVLGLVAKDDEEPDIYRNI